jgi:uncharacterized protein (TIGR02001 family)
MDRKKIRSFFILLWRYIIMKKWSVLLVSVFLLAAGFASSAQAKIEVEGDVYVGLWDKYIWRGFDQSGSKPTIQGGIDLSTNGWTLSYWGNWQLSEDKEDGYESGESNETDIILTYSHDVTDWLNITVGDIWYAIDFGTKDDINRDGSVDTNEVFGIFSFDTLLSPSVKIAWDWDKADEDGLYFTFDIGHTFDLSQWVPKTALNLGAELSYNLHSDYLVGDYAGFHDYELYVSLDYALTDQLTLSPTFWFTSPICDAAKDNIDTETTAAINLTFAF